MVLEVFKTAVNFKRHYHFLAHRKKYSFYCRLKKKKERVNHGQNKGQQPTVDNQMENHGTVFTQNAGASAIFPYRLHLHNKSYFSFPMRSCKLLLG